VSLRFRDPWLPVALLLSLLLIGLVALPQLWILRASLIGPEGDPGLENARRFFSAPRYLVALRTSLLLSAVVAALTLLIAVPLAFFHARYRLPGRDLVLTLATMATVSPPFLGAYVWVMLLGWGGSLTRMLRGLGVPFESIVGFHGVVFVATLGSVGLVFLLAHDAFAGMDPALEEAAMSVGASRLRTHLQISLPLAAPGLLTAAYLTAVTTLADFGTPRIVGGEVSVLPLLVYHEFLGEVSGNPSMAATGSVVMLALSTGALLLQRLLLAGRSYALQSAARAPRQPLGRLASALVLGATALVFALVFVPHLVVTFASFLSWRADVASLPFTLGNYRLLFGESFAPVLVSHGLALVATLVAVVCGTAIAYVSARRAYPVLSSGLSALAMVPFVIPGTVLAVGLIVVFNKPPLQWTGTWMILAVAYLVRKLPYALKSAEAALHQVHPSLEEAALSVGATPARAFRDVTARLILPAIVSGASLTYLMTLTELSATVMLYGSRTTTMSVVIYQAALGLGGQFGRAASTAVVMMASVYLPLYAARRRFAAGVLTGTR
jgi:iron(III) transport system permease protein